VFIQRITRTATPGKARDFRTLLEERTRALQGDGFSTSLATEVYGQYGGTFIASALAEDMATLETLRDRVLGDSHYQATSAKMSALEIAPPRFDLYEIVVPSPRPTPGRFVQRVSFHPSIGRGRDVRALLEEQVRTRQAAGIALMLGERVYGADDAGYLLWISVDRMADIQALRDRNSSDANFIAFQAKLAPLLASEPRMTLAEMLVVAAPAQAGLALAGAARR